MKQKKKTPAVRDVVAFGRHVEDEWLWSVLEIREDTALIISEKAVRVSPYHDQPGQVSWGRSAVRDWINRRFYASAFTGDEKKAIVDVQFAETGGAEELMDPDSFDHLFLLNREEAERYFPKADERALTYTFESAEGLLLGNNGLRTTCCWWLRDSGTLNPGSAHCYIPVCDTEGAFDILLSADSSAAAVRPAAWVKISSLRVMEQTDIDRPLYGYLKRQPLSSVSVFCAGRAAEQRVLGSFADFEQEQEYLLLQPDPYAWNSDMPFFRLTVEPVRSEYTRQKLGTVVNMLKTKPYDRVASELWLDFCRRIVDDSMKQPAWVSRTDDSCPELREGSELTIGRSVKKPYAEPLRWKILVRKGDKALVICRQSLYSGVFSDDYDDDDMIFHMDFINVWEFSGPRKWLNENFYQNAFSPDEQSMIMEYQTEFGDRLGRARPGDRPVFDHCFLLSDAEAAVFFPDNQSRQLMTVTDRANAFSKPGFSRRGQAETWWCRSRADIRGFVACVSPSGAVDMNGRSADTAVCAVRPAMLIDLRVLAHLQSRRDAVLNETDKRRVQHENQS